MKNHCCQGNHSPGQNSNPEPPEYEVGVLVLHHIYIFIYLFITEKVRFKMWFEGENHLMQNLYGMIL